jgi:hypothetical protein
MARRLVESLTGTGPIHAGDQLLRTTRYQISVWWYDDPPELGDDSRPVSTIDGHIDITGIAEAVVLAGPGALTLTLEDKRRLAFHLTSSGGSIVGQSWLSRA